MLIQAKINSEQKFVKITQPSLGEFLNAAFIKFSIPAISEGVRVYNEAGTEVDADVFEEVVQYPNAGVFTIRFDDGSEETPSSGSPMSQASSFGSPRMSQASSSEMSASDSDATIILPRRPRNEEEEAKRLVEAVLTKKPGGDRVIKEYNRTKSLTDSTRRNMVKILCADMTEIHGTTPPTHVRQKYARGIVALFPYLADPQAENGYEHYYDAKGASGFLAWRLKTIQRTSASSSRGESSSQLTETDGGPTARRDSSHTPEMTPSQAQCKEAVSLMKHSSDDATIKQKMKMTFEYRRNMVLDSERSSDVLTEFPRFKDIKGLIEQDFVLLFGEDAASRFLERWPTAFKQKIIRESRTLPTTSDLQELLFVAELASDEEDVDESGCWDSDLCSILLVLHLIPPTAQGRKRPGKVSAAAAEKHVVVFKKSGTSIQEHLDAISTTTQPYLLAVGPKRNTIHDYFIILDKQAIPCASTSALGAFDELFKAHFVFGTSYNQVLYNMYTFMQTTVYEIDIGKVKEGARAAEIRARVLH